MKAIGGKFEEHNLGKIKKELTMIEKSLKNPPEWGSDEQTIQQYKNVGERHVELLKL